MANKDHGLPEESDTSIRCTEFGYHLLSELISMPDRILAQQIELLIWKGCAQPSEPMLQKFVDMLKESESGVEFYEMAKEYISTLNVVWDVHGCIFVRVQDQLDRDRWCTLIYGHVARVN